MKLIGKLFDGPIDIVGDVHGEFAALDRLMTALGYDDAGRHPVGRRLVFVGDLTDRGPDSPAVLDRVAAMVGAGRAQCIVGNHELNLLRDVPKHGNGWWVAPGVLGRLPAVPVDPLSKARFTEFVGGLPIALKRDDLRVVHACWAKQAIDALRRREAEDIDVLGLYRLYVADYERRWSTAEEAAALEAEAAGIDLEDEATPPPLLPRLAKRDAQYQTSNAVTVLTSGVEAPTAKPFWAGGKWRMVERVKWWQRYDDPVPVVIGHYWRRWSDAPAAWTDKYGPDLFDGIEPHHWMGCRGNVYCVDFSVGGRSEQRLRGEPEHVCQLAALRVPEWRVVHDGGEAWDIGPPDQPGGARHDA